MLLSDDPFLHNKTYVVSSLIKLFSVSINKVYHTSSNPNCLVSYLVVSVHTHH